MGLGDAMTVLERRDGARLGVTPALECSDETDDFRTRLGVGDREPATLPAAIRAAWGLRDGGRGLGEMGSERSTAGLYGDGDGRADRGEADTAPADVVLSESLFIDFNSWLSTSTSFCRWPAAGAGAFAGRDAIGAILVVRPSSWWCRDGTGGFGVGTKVHRLAVLLSENYVPSRFRGYCKRSLKRVDGDRA